MNQILDHEYIAKADKRAANKDSLHQLEMLVKKVQSRDSKLKIQLLKEESKNIQCLG